MGERPADPADPTPRDRSDDSDTRRDPLPGDATVPSGAQAASLSEQGPAPQQLFAGRYLTERELGRGGMGRVFLATDQRLGRQVAIKVLRAENHDADAIALLEREARLVASLRHPNILQVHDIGVDEGVPFLVQELLQGRMLKEELAEGPLPVARALELLLEAARGIEAAHAQGVIHCDLKPSNLFVTAEGQLKILDFGIARLQEAPPDGTATTTNSEDSKRSRGGFSGTPTYSSPEQLRCETIDGRSDLFSLGIVLYEMLAGARPFTGRSQLMVSYSVLTRAPVPLPKSVPRPLRRLVLRCLEKEPANRFQTAHELVLALEKELARKPLSKVMRVMQYLGATLLLLATGAAAVAAVRPLLQPAPTVQQITHLPGAVWTARFAPDGQTIYYGEAFDGQKPRVMKSRVGSPELQEEVLADAMLLAVSASGDLAVLLNPEYQAHVFSGTLATVPHAGGVPQVIAEQVRSADFGPDGTLAFARTAGNQSVVECPAGKVLAELPGRVDQLRFSIQGDQLAFLYHPGLIDMSGEVRVLDRFGKSRTLPRTEWPDLRGLAFSGDGQEIFISGLPPGSPSAIFSMQAISLGGSDRALALQQLGNIEIKDVARSGLVLVTQPARTLGLSVSDEHGERSLAEQDEQLLQDLSADGSRVLFTTDPRLKSGDGYIFVRGSDGSKAVHIANGYGGALSPDGGMALTFPLAQLGLPLQLHSLATGASQPLPWATAAALRGRFFPDGRRVLLVGLQGSLEPKLLVLSLEEKTVRVLSDEVVHRGKPAVVSPDGRTVVALTADGRMLEWPVSGGAGKPVVGAETGEEPFLFDASGALVVGRIEANLVKLQRLDPISGHRSEWKDWRVQAPPSTQVIRPLVAGQGTVLAYSPLGWKTHLYVVDGLR